jgi:predicted transcriptional regulator
MRVSEVMTQGVECIGPDATLQEAAAKMKSLDVGPLPVCDDDRLVGMVPTVTSPSGPRPRAMPPRTSASATS